MTVDNGHYLGLMYFLALYNDCTLGNDCFRDVSYKFIIQKHSKTDSRPSRTDETRGQKSRNRGEEEKSKLSSGAAASATGKTTAKKEDEKRVIDQTRITMDERFSKLPNAGKPFIPDENVSIEIERVIEGRPVPFEIPLFWSDAVVVLRRPDEGKVGCFCCCRAGKMVNLLVSVVVGF